MAWTEAQLRAHAQRAVQLELFTIPAYLAARYSIDEQSSKAAESAAEEITEIANEEMMHLELVCNLSNALGQAPRLTGSAAPSYPSRVPFNSHDAVITLGPATKEQLQAFMTLELPTWHDPYDAPDLPPQDRYETIGEFYHSLIDGLKQVYGAGGASWPKGVNQQIYGKFGADRAPITDLDSAIEALELVVLQGEGASKHDPHTDDPRELAHYYKLAAIAESLGPGDLYPTIRNTAGLTYSTRCGALLDFFDASYSHVLALLEASFHGRAKIGAPVGLMYAALQVLAIHVVGTGYEAADDRPDGEQTLTPRFRFTGKSPQQAYDELDAEDRESEAVRSAAEALRLTLG